jgi:hypothetical protein
MRKITLLPLLLLCTLLAACGGANKLPCPFGPENLGAPESITFELINQSCTTICRVYLGAPSCDNWGGDLLLEGDVRIPHGSSYSFQIPAGKFDMLIESCTEDAYQALNLKLRESGSWTFSMEGTDPGEACDASLTIVNNNPSPVCHMWIAGPSSESFGNNWLENDQTIPAGGEMTFEVLPGTYDVKAEDCEFDQLRIDLGMAITDHQTWVIP